MKIAKCILSATLCCLMTQNLYAQAGVANSVDYSPSPSKDPQTTCEQDLLTSYVFTNASSEEVTQDDKDDDDKKCTKPSTSIKFDAPKCVGYPGDVFKDAEQKTREAAILKCGFLAGKWAQYCKCKEGKGVKYTDDKRYKIIDCRRNKNNMEVNCGDFTCAGEPDELEVNHLTSVEPEAEAIASTLCSAEPLTSSIYGAPSLP